MEKVSLDASLRAHGERLEIEYHLGNEGKESVYVLDRLTVFGQTSGIELAPEAFIVRNDPDDSRTVLLSRGYVKPERMDAQWELVPGARTLEPGARLDGRGTVPLPLQEWHPNEGSRPLGSKPSLVVVEIGLLPARCPLRDLPLRGGGTVPIPETADAFQFQTWLRSRPLELPG